MELHLNIILPGPQVTPYTICESTLIGRHPNAEITIDDINVSGYHLHIYPKDNRFWCEDGYQGRASRNGSWLNGKRITHPAILRRGDVLLIGTCQIQITKVEVPQMDETEERSLEQSSTTKLLSLQSFPKMQLSSLRPRTSRQKYLTIATALALMAFGFALVFYQTPRSLALPQVTVERVDKEHLQEFTLSTFALPGKNITLLSPLEGKVQQISKQNNAFVYENDIIAKISRGEKEEEFQRLQRELQKLERSIHKIQSQQLPQLQEALETTAEQLKKIKEVVHRSEQMFAFGEIERSTLEYRRSLAEKGRKKLKKLQELYATRIQTLSQKEQDKQRLEQQHQELRWQLQQSQIQSPIDGYITNLAVSAGEKVTKDQPLCRIVDISIIKLYFRLERNFLPPWRRGEKISVRFPEIPSPGLVKGIISDLHFQSINGLPVHEVIIDIPNPNEVIKLGMQAEIMINKSFEPPCYLVPRKALFSSRNTSYVYIAHNQKSLLKEVTVIAKEPLPGYVAVNGLEEGQKVIVSPPEQLRDQQKIQVQVTAP